MSEQMYRWMMYRLVSFLRYPPTAFFRPPRLALLGFYSTGFGEEVTCYGCGVSHTNFHPGQSIRSQHLLSSPECPLNVGGAALGADDAGAAGHVQPVQALQLDLQNPLPNGVRQLNNHAFVYYSLERQKYIFKRLEPDFRLLVKEGIRLRRFTFFDWRGPYDEPEPLAMHGFFYTGERNQIQCCSCGVLYRAIDLLTVLNLRKTQGMCRKSCRCYF